MWADQQGIPAISPPQVPAGLAPAEHRGWLIKQALAAAAAQGALAHVNHPNYKWALDRDTLAAIAGMRFFEVFNGHPLVHNPGDADHVSTEALWDHLLGLGRRVYGVATDDAHHYQTYSPLYANPGRASVRVGASALTQSALLEALESGHFYASTSVALAECDVRGTALSLCVDARPGERYISEFVGEGGRVLHARRSQSLDDVGRIARRTGRARLPSRRQKQDLLPGCTSAPVATV